MDKSIIFSHSWQNTERLFSSDNIPVLHVDNIYSLIQCLGYVKHILGRHKIDVYYRGQSSLHNNLRPSLYRNFEKLKHKNRYDGYVKSFIQSLKSGRGGANSNSCKQNNSLNKIDDNDLEALLQHYGINTSWIDVVDNIWIAIWFAIHKTNSNKNYIQYKMKSAGEKEYGYIYLISTIDIKKYIIDGKFREESFVNHEINDFEKLKVLDLRIKLPSYFIRPHAQHGLSVKPERSVDIVDYRDYVCGIIRFKVSDAISWIGSNDLSRVEYMFPPPVIDVGYRKLLENYNVMITNNSGNVADWKACDIGSIVYVWP